MTGAQRYARPAFVGLVTIVLVALVMEQASQGPAGLPGVAVYAFAAGFGLEFLGAAWTGKAARRRGGRRLPS